VAWAWHERRRKGARYGSCFRARCNLWIHSVIVSHQRSIKLVRSITHWPLGHLPKSTNSELSFRVSKCYKNPGLHPLTSPASLLPPSPTVRQVAARRERVIEPSFHPKQEEPLHLVTCARPLLCSNPDSLCWKNKGILPLIIRSLPVRWNSTTKVAHHRLLTLCFRSPTSSLTPPISLVQRSIGQCLHLRAITMTISTRSQQMLHLSTPIHLFRFPPSVRPTTNCRIRKLFSR